MANTPARRRFFAIRANVEKRDANTILLPNGVRVTITHANSRFAETIRQRDAEQAYEQAAMGRLAA